MEIIIYFFIICVISLFLLLTLKNKKVLNKNQKDFFTKKIQEQINNKNISNKEKYIHLDKIYHKILLEYGYKGTFGEILKQNPKIIENIQKIWELHKIRNKIVHEMDDLDKDFLEKQLNNYIKELFLILK